MAKKQQTTTQQTVTQFPELTHKQNVEIDAARLVGFCGYFPAYPNADAQARNTLNAARKYLHEYKAMKNIHDGGDENPAQFDAGGKA